MVSIVVDLVIVLGTVVVVGGDGQLITAAIVAVDIVVVAIMLVVH